ncbi:MAG TPA: hypothetical protein VGF45_04310 [Polyangia bacterium]
MNAEIIKGLPPTRLVVGALIFMVLPAALWLGWRAWLKHQQTTADKAAAAERAQQEADVAALLPSTAAGSTSSGAPTTSPATPALAETNAANSTVALDLPKLPGSIPGPPGTKREMAATQGPYQIELFLEKGPTKEESAKRHISALQAAGFAVEVSPASRSEGLGAQIVYFVRGHGRSGTVIVVADDESGVTTTVMSTPEEQQ